MTKQEFIKLLSDVSGIQMTTCQRVMDSFPRAMREAMLMGESVMFKEFGKFEVQECSAHKGFSLKDGKVVEHPATSRVKFTPSRGLKDSLKEREDWK